MATSDNYFTFDITNFRTLFPAFANTTDFPDALLTQNWTNATSYIVNNNYGVQLVDNDKFYALNLMTAHLTQLGVVIANGQTPGLVQNAAVGAVNISLTPPPIPNQFQWWLNQTAYGQQLLSLLQTKASGGFLVGGLPERSAIRKVYGTFCS